MPLCQECRKKFRSWELAGGTGYERHPDARGKPGGLYPLLCPTCRAHWDPILGCPHPKNTLDRWLK